MGRGFIFCNPGNANVAPKLATLTGGYVTIEPVEIVPTNPNWRALIVKGSASELVALAGAPTGMIAICALSASNNYPELGDTVDPRLPLRLSLLQSKRDPFHPDHRPP